MQLRSTLHLVQPDALVQQACALCTCIASA
jgi:hypothetical protein